VEFQGTVNKVEMTTKKDGEIEKDYLKLTVLIPINNKTDFAGFAKHYHNISEFTMESLQGEFGV